MASCGYSISWFVEIYQMFVCQTNMHLIMWIENAFKFCGKLIHFYKERISFLFYCEDGKSGAVSWLSLNAVGNGEYRPGQLYILSSRVAPDTTDADVHALCTKPAVLKMKESGKSSRNHRTVRGTDILLTSFIEGAPYRKGDSTWHNGRW
jgi:hypothetical protein